MSKIVEILLKAGYNRECIESILMLLRIYELTEEGKVNENIQ